MHASTRTSVHTYMHKNVHTQIQILIPLRGRIIKIYSLHLKFVVTKSGRFSLAFPAFSAINIQFYKLDGQMTLKLQNEPFNILYYCSKCIRRNKFQKDKFPHGKLSSTVISGSCFYHRQKSGQDDSSGNDSDVYWDTDNND